MHKITKIILYIKSIYSILYIQNLLYMLQKSEYVNVDFIKWYFRVADFSSIQKRGKLDWTIKVKIFNLLLWSSAIVFILMIAAWMYFYDWKFSLSLLFLPLVLPCELLIINKVFYVLQIPYEKYLIHKAKLKLKTMKAYKIAIVGSYGKTSQREILYTILKQEKKVRTVAENFNTPLGIANFIQTLEGDEEILIFEFGEYYRGDIKYLCKFVMPDIGIITGINEAHLEKFKTIGNTIKTIFEIADYLGDDKVYVNVDSRYVAENRRSTNILFSKVGVANVQLVSKNLDLNGTDFVLDISGENLNFKMQLLGEHNLAPVMLSVYLANKLSYDMGGIIRSVAELKAFKHRMELKQMSDGVTMLDDSYNGNIDGFMAMLAFLRNIQGGRIVYITPGLVETGSKNEELHRKIGKQILETGNIQNVVLIRNSATTYIDHELQKSKNISVLQFDSMPECLAKMNSFTLPGDLVVIQNDWGDQYN